MLLFVHSYEGWGLLLGLSYHQSPYSTESKTNVRILQWLRILTPIIFSEPGGATMGWVDALTGAAVKCTWAPARRCSFAHLCPALCNSMDCSTPGFPVHYLPEFAQTHVRWVGSIYHLHKPLTYTPCWHFGSSEIIISLEPLSIHPECEKQIYVSSR